MQITAIYIFPGHNYFAHLPARGIAGGRRGARRRMCRRSRSARDRFFDYKEDYKRQVTFFAAEVHEALSAALAIEGKPPGVYRRNVITRDVDLNALIGREFEVRGVRFLGASECSPCAWMDEAVAPRGKFFQGARRPAGAHSYERHPAR